MTLSRDSILTLPVNRHTDALVAEHVVGLKLNGWAPASNYEGCWLIHPGLEIDEDDEIQLQPLCIDPEWQDGEPYPQDDPSEYVNGVHVCGLTVVPFFTSSLGDVWKLIEHKPNQRWYFTIDQHLMSDWTIRVWDEEKAVKTNGNGWAFEVNNFGSVPHALSLALLLTTLPEMG